MKYGVYPQLKVAHDYSTFEFVSMGKKGDILKGIAFTEIESPYVYNLAFGDIDENGEIDDRSISDNGDRNKVLATVAFAVDIYLSKYPQRWVQFKGSTHERTRLYRMAVGLNFDELSTKYDIYIELNNGLIIPFQKNVEVRSIIVNKKT